MKDSQTTEGFCLLVSAKCRFTKLIFGWGKPTCRCNGMRLNDVLLLIDSCDCEGTEVWVGLPKQDMARFQQGPAILACTS